jgi:DNA-binding beta-propeller fold protein YncE
MAPVLGPDQHTLLVCNRFDNDVGVLDLGAEGRGAFFVPQTSQSAVSRVSQPADHSVNGRARRSERPADWEIGDTAGWETCGTPVPDAYKLKDRVGARIAVQREPVAATLAGRGKYLLVANRLPTGRADTGTVSAVVSVVDWAAGQVVKELPLPDGGVSLNDIQASPDGQYAVVTHGLARYHLPANEVERGWMNANALTIIDLTQLKILNTVLLDEAEQGAANPWGIAWSADSRTLVITHAGTHEVSVIDFPALLARLGRLPAALPQPPATDYGTAARVQADVPNDLAFLNGVRRRVKLAGPDRGPRAVVMIGARAYVADYFSDTVSVVETAGGSAPPASIALGPPHALSAVRLGELDFHDATLCHQGWQSCSTCHPGDARADGLNWDLPNDGLGNPKNTKSLLLAHRTPPVMSLGVRGTAEQAVRAGIKNILFTPPREDVASAMDEYLKSRQPVPSPWLVRGQLSPAAKRGEALFARAGCANCHVPGLFTDLQAHEVGTRAAGDGPGDKFYTPTLIEIWRTAPYLHDGSAATLRDVLTTRNTGGRHGATADLSAQQLDDLSAYVLSL